jgi:hypothetical protein
MMLSTRFTLNHTILLAEGIMIVDFDSGMKEKNSPQITQIFTDCANRGDEQKD